jgi:Protein of unknown function (DUF1404)
MRLCFVWVIIAVDLLIFWHLPWVFDFAELDVGTHIAQHGSFIVVGAVGFLSARSLGETFKLFALFALNGIMGFAGLMLSVMDTPIYLVYSVNSHNNARIWMLIMFIVLLVIVIPVYVIKRALFYARIRQAYRTD